MPKRSNLKMVVIPEELNQKMQSYCAKYGLSRSELIRSSVVDFLERKGG